MYHRVSAAILISSALLFLPASVFASSNTNIHLGSHGNLVVSLQQFLVSQDLLPAGSTSGYFGKLTQQAVIAFQHKQGIVPATGFVGPFTRSRMYGMQGGGTNPPSSSTSQTGNNYYGSSYNGGNTQTGTPSQGTGSSNGSGTNLASCQGNAYLTHAPTDLSSITSISPLGATSNSGHITPSDHLYFNLNRAGGSTGTSGALDSALVNIYAPGDATIVRIEKQTHTLPWNGGRTVNDYAITFAPCRELNIFYYHIASVSDKIANALSSQNAQSCSNGASTQGISNSNCSYSLNLHVDSGELIGSAGGPGLGSFDVGGYDMRTSELPFIDKTRFLASSPQQYLHDICPLDYYADQTLKNSLYTLLNNTKKNASGFPDCGSIAQDKTGTLQGDWFIGDTPGGQQPQPIQTMLSVIHLNTAPAQGVISVGGTINDISVNRFTPAHTGAHNTEPSLVAADGNIYCYDSNFWKGYYLFQLVDSSHLQAEFQTSGSCPTAPQFSQPITYQR